MSNSIRHNRRGWLVTAAGTGINLALGVIYAWSVISHHIPVEWGWSESARSWPYSIGILVLSWTMIPAGYLLDRFGPRRVATVGGILVGAGFFLASRTQALSGYIIGFGILAGIGMGFGYASAMPAAVKWFPKHRTGLIAGIVVSGFGLASVYVAPLAEHLLQLYGVPRTMSLLGTGFLAVILFLAQFLSVPSSKYAGPSEPGISRLEDHHPFALLRMRKFYLLWLMFFCAGGAGLMIISKLAAMVDLQTGRQFGFLLVAALALGNGSGRVGAGLLADKVGGVRAFFICALAQSLCITGLGFARMDNVLGHPLSLILISILIGSNYGANLAIFPALTREHFGVRHFGMNYGLVSTAWGGGGFVFALFAGWVFDVSGGYAVAYLSAVILLLGVMVLSRWMVKAGHR